MLHMQRGILNTVRNKSAFFQKMLDIRWLPEFHCHGHTLSNQTFTTIKFPFQIIHTVTVIS